MKGRTGDYEGQQSAYLLEYDRRRILNCADTFQNLAGVFTEMNREEGEGQDTALQDREQALQKREAQENRRHYADYLRQMAGLLRTVAGTSVQMIRLGGRQEKQIIRALASEGILVQDIYLLRGQENQLEISVSLRMRKNISITAEQVAGYLSVLMDLRLVPEKRNPYFVGRDMVTLYFEEEASYSYLTAAATAVKETEKVSGDSFSFWEEDGCLAMILSDGVGSGETAKKDSRRIVELTEQILDAGLSIRMAAQLLDGMVRTEGGETHMATLDVCRLDLKKGECAFVKAGAASTYIKRGPQVEKVSGTELPLGLMSGETERETVRRLEAGDMVIMISDGVTQDWPCGDGEYFLIQQMEKASSRSPVDMANLLLRYAIGQCQGKIRDDMTILVTGIWENPG